MTARLIRRAGALTLIAATTAAALTGCGAGIGAKLTFDDTEKAKITDIVIGGSSGGVQVTTGAAAETQIRRVIRSNGPDPEQSYRVDGSTLHLNTNCGHFCSVSYEVTAPAGVKVRGNLGSGDVALSEVGSADISVSSGQVTLDRIAGEVKARAESGEILADGLSGAVTLGVNSGSISASGLSGGKPVRASASSGDIVLGLAAPASVSAQATSGTIELTVPRDGTYRFAGPSIPAAPVPGADENDNDHDNGNEDFESDLPNDPSATNVLELRASSGTIRVAGV